jgi:hypothetical protein
VCNLSQCKQTIFRERMLLEESSVKVGRVGPYVHTAVQRIVRRERGTAVKKLRIVFGWEVAHAAVSRRPPISLYTMVARTSGYAYASKCGIRPSFKDHSLSPAPT